MDRLPKIRDKRIIVGFNTADDAGVFQISKNKAIVQTVDVFAPVIDDPYLFGQIAACNSLSDIYAMGGKPLLAMNVVGFHPKYPLDWFGKMLLGAQKKAKEANTFIVGGHTFVSEQVMFGLAVTGFINPKKIITNANAKPNDYLVLTKPLGIEIFSYALLRNIKISDKLYKSAVKSMITLNDKASEAMVKVGVSSATDITGFGLVGHLYEMIKASKVGAEIYVSNLPILPDVLNLIKTGIVGAGYGMNFSSFSNYVVFENGISEEYKVLIFSSETSGGLLISVSEEKLPRLEKELIKHKIIGRIVKDHPGIIFVRK